MNTPQQRTNANQPPPTRLAREGFIDDDDRPQATAPAPERTPAPAVDEPAADVPADPVPDTWPKRMKLVFKPIPDNKNRMISELSFREPTAADIMRHGNPARWDSRGELVVDEAKMTMIISALSGIFSSEIEKMDPRDWNSAAYLLRHFFLPDARAYSLERTKV